MNTGFLIVIGVVAGIGVLGILFAVSTPPLRDASQFNIFDEPKTTWDCRMKFGKGTTEMFECLEKLEMLAETSGSKVWVSLPETSCAYPWHPGNDNMTEIYVDEYREKFGSYDSTDPLQTSQVFHYVIQRHYADRGIIVHDVMTDRNSSQSGTGEGCNTVLERIWMLQVSNSDLDYFLNNGYNLVEEFDSASIWETKKKECFKFFNCDPFDESFSGCIGSKRDGTTIEKLCYNYAEITIDGGCISLQLPENMTAVRCE